MRLFALWLAAGLFSAGGAMAQQPGDQETATDWLRNLAEGGTMEGRLMLLDQAMHGSAEAQYAVALLFRGGAAIPRDMDAARHWYQAAAAQGHRASLESLRLLASEGDGGAFYALGILNRDGLGVPHDAKAARTAFKWAGEEGHVLGLFAEADMLAAGVGGASDEVAAMTRYGQIADLARTELNFSQEDPAGEPRGGDARAAAQYWIGKLYLAGAAGLRQNAVEAATWFAGAAQAGVAMAQYELGLLYRQGRGVPRDRARALAWLESAAAKGMPGAQQEIERMGRDQ